MYVSPYLKLDLFLQALGCFRYLKIDTTTALLKEVNFFASGSSLGISFFLHRQHLGTSAFGGDSQEVLRSSFNLMMLFQS